MPNFLYIQKGLSKGLINIHIGSGDSPKTHRARFERLNQPNNPTSGYMVFVRQHKYFPGLVNQIYFSFLISLHRLQYYLINGVQMSGFDLSPSSTGCIKKFLTFTDDSS